MPKLRLKLKCSSQKTVTKTNLLSKLTRLLSWFRQSFKDQGLTESGMKKRKSPMSGSSLGENTLLMSWIFPVLVESVK